MKNQTPKRKTKELTKAVWGNRKARRARAGTPAPVRKFGAFA